MRKWIIGLLAALLVLCCSSAALAAEAVNIANECTWKLCGTKYKYTKMTDGKFTTNWASNKVKNPFVQITAPAGTPIYGLYICFATMPDNYEIQVEKHGEWVTYAEGDTRFYHMYYNIPEGVDKVRLYVNQDKFALTINELFVLSSGDKPDWVQTWEETPEKADIMFLMAHPDDDLIFLGGAIPTYAVEQQREVVCAYLSFSNTTRRSELLNALWSMGVRKYPVIGSFHDSYTKNVKDAYKSVGGQNKVLEWVTGLFRQYKPEVVVTHDPNGEYGHGMHKMLVDACEQCYSLAAMEGQHLDSFFEYGTWQVKKLYEHLGGTPDTQIRLDWSVPLQSMGGKTGLQLAIEAFEYHVTQQGTKYDVANTGTSEKYSNEIFGLVKTEVGPDVRKDDFLENIYDAPGSYVPAPATPTPEPVVTPEPAYLSQLPPLNEKGFLDDGEFYIADDTNGLYVYIDQTTKIVIERKEDTKAPLTWFEAEIWSDVEAGAMLKTIQRNPEKMGKARGDAAETARMHNVVFAMNTDYYTYRVGSSGSRHVGVVIRDGKILYDDRYGAINDYFPNLDTLAFYEDGSMGVYASCELSAQDYLDKGAYAVYSFGPYLIRDGKLSERAYTSAETKNPRCAVGMVEPGHYVAILAEGRLKRSGGITINGLALLMREKGCTVACNLDGGQTAVMCFMGKQLNLIGKYDGKTSARPTSEIMGIGFSDLVGNVEFK